MIHNFIFYGDFLDPHNEFFIEKKYRRNAESIKQDYSSDFIFMLTDDIEKKIPCFLVSIAPTIFKAGSSVYLLTRQDVFRDQSESTIIDIHAIDLYF
jgi:hypothetical protein